VRVVNKTRYAVLGLVLLALMLLPSVVLADQVGRATKQETYADMWNNGVVVVLVGDQYGTGWWAAKNYIVTAGHVVNYETNIKVTLVHGDWSATGYVVYVNNAHDVAVIKCAEPPAEQYIFAVAASMPDQGVNIYVIGYPFELYKITGDIKVMSANPRVTQGIISWEYPDKQLFEFSAPTDAGNSGGPIVTESGAVVGLVSFALEGKVTNMYYGSDVNAIKDALSRVGIKYKSAMLDTIGSSITSSSSIRPWLIAVVLGIGASVVTTAIIVPNMIRGRKR